jgi:serine/threonine protein phosphatase PrpC
MRVLPTPEQLEYLRSLGVSCVDSQTHIRLPNRVPVSTPGSVARPATRSPNRVAVSGPPSVVKTATRPLPRAGLSWPGRVAVAIGVVVRSLWTLPVLIWRAGKRLRRHLHRTPILAWITLATIGQAAIAWGAAVPAESTDPLADNATNVAAAPALAHSSAASPASQPASQPACGPATRPATADTRPAMGSAPSITTPPAVAVPPLKPATALPAAPDPDPTATTRAIIPPGNATDLVAAPALANLLAASPASQPASQPSDLASDPAPRPVTADTRPAFGSVPSMTTTPPVAIPPLDPATALPTPDPDLAATTRAIIPPGNVTGVVVAPALGNPPASSPASQPASQPSDLAGDPASRPVTADTRPAMGSAPSMTTAPAVAVPPMKPMTALPTADPEPESDRNPDPDPAATTRATIPPAPPATRTLGLRQADKGAETGGPEVASMPLNEVRSAPPTLSNITISVPAPTSQPAQFPTSRLDYVALGQTLCLLACAAAILSLRRNPPRNHGQEIGQALRALQHLRYHRTRRPRPLPSKNRAPTQRASFVAQESRPPIHTSRSILSPAHPGNQSARPEDPLDHLIELSRELGFAVLPERTPGKWELGLASVTGPVRTHNEDSAMAFRIGDCHVMIVADGCGGHPMGGSAPRWAGTAAALSIVRSLNYKPDAVPRWGQGTATRAVFDASRLLGEAGRTLGLLWRDRPALRTTLIIVVATPAAAGYAYIGDGGGVLLRTSGKIERFLEPQKGEDQGMLMASLGPEMDGGPVSGTLLRQEGDLLIVGTDGVFDRTTPAFAKDLLASALDGFDGNLQALCDGFLTDFCKKTDAAGPIGDDNMTLGILGSGHRPVMQRGSWSRDPEDSGQAYVDHLAGSGAQEEDLHVH